LSFFKGQPLSGRVGRVNVRETRRRVVVARARARASRRRRLASPPSSLAPRAQRPRTSQGQPGLSKPTCHAVLSGARVPVRGCLVQRSVHRIINHLGRPAAAATGLRQRVCV